MWQCSLSRGITVSSWWRRYADNTLSTSGFQIVVPIVWKHLWFSESVCCEIFVDHKSARGHCVSAKKETTQEDVFIPGGLQEWELRSTLQKAAEVFYNRKLKCSERNVWIFWKRKGFFNSTQMTESNLVTYLGAGNLYYFARFNVPYKFSDKNKCIS